MNWTSIVAYFFALQYHATHANNFFQTTLLTAKVFTFALC
jgi:hypothetical protein